MADPMAELEELDTINTERVAAGLAETSSIAEAREWKAQQGEVKKADGAEQVKAEEPKPIGDAAPVAEPVKFTAPVAKRAEQPADGGELAAAKAEIQRLKSEAGRSTVLAHEMRELKAKADAAEARAVEAERKAQELADKASEGDLMAGLTPEQREALNDNPNAASAILALAKKFVSKGASASDSGVNELRERIEARERMEAERDAAERQARANAMWGDKVSTVIPPEVYARLDGNPKWDEWCNQRYSGQFNADLYNNAIASADHEAVIDHLRRALRYANIEIPAKGSKPPLRVDSTISGGATPTNTDTDENKRFRYDEINAINQRFVRGQGLPTGWSMKDFTAWSERMEKAQSEGRVVDENGVPVRDLPL